MGIADELITRGHNKNGLYSDDAGRVCLYGAAYNAFTGNDELTNAACEAIEKAVQIVSGDPTTWCARFNDSPSTSYDDVLRVAKLADEILDAR